MTYKVCNNKEVTRKSHLFHHTELILQPLFMCRCNACTKSFFEATLCLFLQPRVFTFTCWNLKLRKQVFPFAQSNVATLCDQQGVIATFRNLLKQFTHLGCGLYIKGVIIKLKSLRICQGRTGLNTEQRLVSACIFLSCVVQIICCKQWQS